MDLYVLFLITDINTRLLGVFDTLDGAKEAALNYELETNMGEPLSAWEKTVKGGSSGRKELHYQHYRNGKMLKVQRCDLNTVIY